MRKKTLFFLLMVVGTSSLMAQSVQLITSKLSYAQDFAILSGESIRYTSFEQVNGAVGAMKQLLPEDNRAADSTAISNGPGSALPIGIAEMHATQLYLSQQNNQVSLNGDLGAIVPLPGVYTINGDAVIPPGDTLVIKVPVDQSVPLSQLTVVFNILGNFRVGANSRMDIGALHPNQIIWNVQNDVTIEGNSELMGIILSGGNVLLGNNSFGYKSVLAQGGVNMQGNARNMQSMRTMAYVSPEQCSTTKKTCSAAYVDACNLITNTEACYPEGGNSSCDIDNACTIAGWSRFWGTPTYVPHFGMDATNSGSLFVWARSSGGQKYGEAIRTCVNFKAGKKYVLSYNERIVYTTNNGNHFVQPTNQSASKETLYFGLMFKSYASSKSGQEIPPSSTFGPSQMVSTTPSALYNSSNNTYSFHRVTVCFAPDRDYDTLFIYPSSNSSTEQLNVYLDDLELYEDVSNLCP